MAPRFVNRFRNSLSPVGRVSACLALFGFWLSGALTLAQTAPVRPTAAPSTRTKPTIRRTPSPKPTSVRPSRAQSAAVKPAASQASRAKPAPNRKRSVRPSRKAAGRSVPSQARPTPERYREIQAALIERGFLSGEASGQWDESSVDALKQFERSQKLSPDGKIDALALIALGLGPRRDAPIVNPGPPSSAGPAQEQK